AMQAYARACVSSATEALRAEHREAIECKAIDIRERDASIRGWAVHARRAEARAEALRAEVEALKSDVSDYMRAANEEATRAERLAEALQRLVNSFPEEGVLLDAGWDGCEVDEACEAYDAARAA